MDHKFADIIRRIEVVGELGHTIDLSPSDTERVFIISGGSPHRLGLALYHADERGHPYWAYITDGKSIHVYDMLFTEDVMFISMLVKRQKEVKHG